MPNLLFLAVCPALPLPVTPPACMLRLAVDHIDALTVVSAMLLGVGGGHLLPPFGYSDFQKTKAIAVIQPCMTN